MPEFGKFIHKLINKEIGAELTEKAYNAPERPVEEIYALWRDFGRLKMQIGKLERDRKRKKVALDKY